MSLALADLRFTWRLLRRQPAFTAAMILTLALGIGVNTAISSVVRSILIDPERLAAALLTGFAALALALAALGIYAVVAYSVASRRREIGVRMALGAERAQVIRLVLRRSLGLTAAGVVLGLLLSWWGVRLLASQLYATEPYDLLTWLGLTLLVAAGSVAACLLPAWRASRVQPAAVLHWE